MVSSPTVVSPPPPKPLTSDGDDDEYEIVYEEIEEEIEVEEEVEVEEEIEEEDDVGAEHIKSGGEVEIGEDLTASSQKNLKNDTGKILELDEHKDHIQSSSLIEGVFVKNVGDAKTSESSEKEELYVNGGKVSKYNKEKTLLNDSGEVNHAKTTPFVGDVNATSTMANASGKNASAIASIMAETNQSALEGVGNISPRLHAAKIRFRDPLPSAEFGRESKKLRIVCEFHAKGWCVRGKSCRFLHIKDGPDAVMLKSEALGREASSSACIPPLQSGENPKLHSETEKLVLLEDDTDLGAPTQDDRWSFRHKLYLDNYRNYGSPPVRGILSARDSAYHGSSSITSHDNDFDTRVSCFGPTMDEINSKKSNIVQSDPRLADLPDSYTRHALPFCNSSRNSSARGPHKFLQSSLEHHAYVSSSMQQSIPQASRFELDTLPSNRSFGEAEPAKFEATFSSFDWEPSAPFRPCHEITRSILLKECGYNPMHDHTDKKDVQDIRARFSHSDQGSSIKNVNVQSSIPQWEESVLNYVLAGDTVKDNILSSSNGDKVKHDKTMDGTILEVDGSGTKDDTEADFKRDDHVQSESKAFKYFQSALIESVKELVKPFWREGFLSKDAHKLIVKKAVDKVLSTLPTHQIPSTAESVKLYLSSSQPKLAKLVEGYLKIYGKT